MRAYVCVDACSRNNRGGGGPRCRLDFMQNENQLRVLTMRVRAIRRLLKQPAAILPFLERK